MKKIIATLVLLFGVTLLAHADTTQTNPLQAPADPLGSSAKPNATDSISNEPQPGLNDEQKKSDDDDDANTLNDPDPEADVDSDKGSPPAQQS